MVYRGYKGSRILGPSSPTKLEKNPIYKVIHMTKSLTYADAGVDIDKADNLVNKIKKIAERTPRSGVMGEIGGFGGLFSLNLSNLVSPVLVSSTDGVGTKLKIAFMTGKHDTIGIDLVAMCVNDIVVQGAQPACWHPSPIPAMTSVAISVSNFPIER